MQAQEYLDTGKLSDLLKKYSHSTAVRFSCRTVNK